MFYDLLNPPGLVSGDLLLLENVGSISDLLRFDPTAGTGGGVFVYSDISPGDLPDALADIGLPTALNTNTAVLMEVGPEGNNGIVYTPTAGQPGFVSGAGGPVTYTFLSDTPSPVPEPASIGVVLIGTSILLSRLRRRRAGVRP